MKTTKFRTFLAVIAVLVLALTACPTPDENSTAVTTPQTVATPAAIPAGGEVADNTPIALATSTAGAAIYYTQDGTEPSAASTRYSDSAKPTISTGKLILKALAVKDGMSNSAVLTAVYTLTPPNTAAMPVATPAGGEVADNTPIALATSTAEASIYYTQDGTEPTAASTLYSDTAKPVITAGKLTLKAVAVKSGMNNSAVLTATYTIAAATPPTASITNNNQTVTLAPELEITLNGAATKGTNEIKSYEWAVKTTENGVTPVFTSGTTAVTKVTGIKKAGTYVFELKVKDTADLEATAQATVTVNAMTVTTTVTISATTFGSGTSLNFTPTYTSSNTTDFPIASIGNYITYTVTASNGSPNTWNSANGSVTVPYIPAYNGVWTTFTQTFYKNGIALEEKRIFEVFAASGSFDSFGGDDGDWEDTISVPAITGITISKTITEILPPPVTKTVTVTFPSAVLPSDTTGVPTLDLTPSYAADGGWDSNFQQSAITYTLKDDRNNTITNFNNVTASNYGANVLVTFTQRFEFNGQTFERSFVGYVANMAGTKKFLEFYSNTTSETPFFTLSPITLTLTKQ